MAGTLNNMMMNTRRRRMLRLMILPHKMIIGMLTRKASHSPASLSKEQNKIRLKIPVLI